MVGVAMMFFVVVRRLTLASWYNVMPTTILELVITRLGRPSASFGIRFQPRKQCPVAGSLGVARIVSVERGT